MQKTLNLTFDHLVDCKDLVDSKLVLKLKNFFSHTLLIVLVLVAAVVVVVEFLVGTYAFSYVQLFMIVRYLIIFDW